MKSLQEIRSLISRLTLQIFSQRFNVRCEIDNKYDAGRIFIQVIYTAPCNKSGVISEWHGRKYYLSEFMTDDEIVKTCFAAFKATVEHEIMEGFLVDGTVLFNPHTHFEELLKVSIQEVSRKLTNGEHVTK